ncbi:MAG: methionyl-tRNA formyltransferase [Actinomycetota bacterium]
MASSLSLRVGFLGNDRWSVPSLEALASSTHRVEVVLTRVPRPAGRGSKLRPTAVADAARRRRLPIEETETVRSGPGFDAVVSAGLDVLTVVAYGEILPAEVLSLPRLGCVNVHFSLLPRLRGASPVQTALLSGLAETGVTTMLMDSGLDTGPIFLQSAESIRDADDAGALGGRLAQAGAELLVQTLDRLAGGSLMPIPQIESMASHAPKLTLEDRWLDWSEAAEALTRRVRALSPEPGASTRFRGEVLKVFRAEAVAGRGAVGAILAADGNGFAVGTGDGVLRLLEVVPAGRRRMTASEFVRGFHPREGERLG